MEDFVKRGKVSFILGAQYGSEGKGAAAAYVASQLANKNNHDLIVTTNAGVQSGHTSIHNGQKRVLFHLPTTAIVLYDMGHHPIIYLNAGAIIDPAVLKQELESLNINKFSINLFIHPNAAVITDECRDAEMQNNSAQTKIASTRKGVGEALARKTLRSGLIARDHPYLKKFVRRIDINERIRVSNSPVLVEVPQGFSLSVNQPFYPYCTSRDCTVGQAMSDAGIHPEYYGASMLVVRTYPIRVGNIKDQDHQIGWSGTAYPGQRELTWEQLGQTPEITTVTKRVRRVFDFSYRQLADAMASARPTHVFLSFCDYLKDGDEGRYTRAIKQISSSLGLTPPRILFAYGPATDQVFFNERKADI